MLGGVVLSHRVYNQIFDQRNELITSLVKNEVINLENGLEGVVFSRDRALQLFTLLHSYQAKVRDPAKLYVIYSVSSIAHLEAYDELIFEIKSAGMNVNFIKENESFKSTLISVLYLIKTKNIFFLVDDDVFIRETDLTIAKQIDPIGTVLSLRHSPHLKFSYTAKAALKSPTFTHAIEGEGLLKFTWFEQNLEWSDPWSVDGQILSTAELRILANISNFKAPNSFEQSLKSFNSLCNFRFGLCYEESKILNLPINRVQTEVSNRSGNIDADYLLRCWNDGLMLDVRPLEKHIPLSPHEEHALGFVKRNSISFRPFQASTSLPNIESDSLDKKN